MPTKTIRLTLVTTLTKIQIRKIAYDNALSNAEHLLNQQNDPTMDPREINAAAQKVKETKDALHGADKLTQSQNESNETINHLPNLNDKQNKL